ncbi:MAG: DNA cytosine methyltransferase, partial [Candidatus Paceibacterota bacterium]
DPVDLEVLIDEHGEDVVCHLNNLIQKGYVRHEYPNRYDLRRTFNGKYRRLSMKEPCTTVDTRFGNPIYFLHPEEDRGFTVREAARIQGFPDDFVFDGSLVEMYKMIGNAVPPPLSEIVANIVRNQLLPNE